LRDHGRIGQAGERAAFIRPDVLAQLGEAAEMRLVDHGFRPRHVGRAIIAPIERVVGHHGLGHAGGAVAPVERQIGARRLRAIAVQCIGPVQTPDEPGCIGIEQQLVWIEAMTALRVVWTVGAIAVDRAGFGIWQIAVPDLIGVFGHGETRDFAPAGRIEQAQIDPLGMGGEDREICSEAVPCGTQRIRLAGQQVGGNMAHG